jgi:hypothetical protein
MNIITGAAMTQDASLSATGMNQNNIYIRPSCAMPDPVSKKKQQNCEKFENLKS